MLHNLLLTASYIGLTGSTVFLFLAGLAVLRFRASTPQARPATLPKVSLLKPLCGQEPNLEANLESFFRQDYPDFEIVFGARNAEDSALQVVHALQKRYPRVPVKVVLSGEPAHPNAKVCSLEKMCTSATSNLLVISDSDVRVNPSYVREVVEPLSQPEIGMVTCLYRGVATGGPWALLEALGMSVEMTSGVLVANMLEGMRFALGPTMAIRREVLVAVGGIVALADYCSDDYLLGQKVHEAGWKVVLSHLVIDHVIVSQEFRPSVLHQVRWMKSTRFSRGLAHVGTGLTFAMPYGLLGLATAAAIHRPTEGMLLLTWAVVNRLLLALIAGWGAIRDRQVLRYFWIYPLRDLMGFCFWCASFFGNTIHWRGERYALQPGGKMRRLAGTSPHDQESQSVAVDHLA